MEKPDMGVKLVAEKEPEKVGKVSGQSRERALC
jgi:hypothetical protein